MSASSIRNIPLDALVILPTESPAVWQGILSSALLGADYCGKGIRHGRHAVKRRLHPACYASFVFVCISRKASTLVKASLTIESSISASKL